jgi:hypothetical protein
METLHLRGTGILSSVVSILTITPAQAQSPPRTAGESSLAYLVKGRRALILGPPPRVAPEQKSPSFEVIEEARCSRDSGHEALEVY